MKLQGIIGEMADKHHAHMMITKGLIERAEEACNPRAYISNRKTNKIHRALTYFADVGAESI